MEENKGQDQKPIQMPTEIQTKQEKAKNNISTRKTIKP